MENVFDNFFQTFLKKIVMMAFRGHLKISRRWMMIYCLLFHQWTASAASKVVTLSLFWFRPFAGRPLSLWKIIDFVSQSGETSSNSPRILSSQHKDANAQPILLLFYSILPLLSRWASFRMAWLLLWESPIIVLCFFRVSFCFALFVLTALSQGLEIRRDHPDSLRSFFYMKTAMSNSLSDGTYLLSSACVFKEPWVSSIPYAFPSWLRLVVCPLCPKCGSTCCCRPFRGIPSGHNSTHFQQLLYHHCRLARISLYEKAPRSVVFLVFRCTTLSDW